MAETSFCPLSVDLLSYKRDKYMNVEDYTFPAYENVVRPLFDASIQAFDEIINKIADLAESLCDEIKDVTL
ncbi:hypothetical protein [Paenibacillus elgii]|uniref:hypothetical protein n=1 Tax=Paenibacillus elgii TaxID=189691 RepID=UPI000248D6D5|nr:hypothetical protein [Paenibacillus elgii]